MKKITILVLTLLLLWSTTSGCAKKNYYDPDTETQTETVKTEIKAITLDQSALELNIGEAALLAANISPLAARSKPVKWISSNEKIVTVNPQGIVFAKKEGTATITVSDETNKIQAKCNIKVNSIRKAVITGNVPTEASGGEVYRINIGFENCIFPSVKIITDCGGGSIQTDTETIKLGSKPNQVQVVGKAAISFSISSKKSVNNIRILCFDNGELFDCKEYSISLVKKEEQTIPN